MHLTEKCRYAVDVFADRLEDKQIHYGLVFVLPDGINNSDTGGIRKCSDANTSSRHGTIEDWYLGTVSAWQPPQNAVLLIPRTWLIRQGYLPWWVLFAPYRSFAMRRVAALQTHFWLEWGDDSRVETTEAVSKAA